MTYAENRIRQLAVRFFILPLPTGRRAVARPALGPRALAWGLQSPETEAALQYSSRRSSSSSAIIQSFPNGQSEGFARCGQHKLVLPILEYQTSRAPSVGSPSVGSPSGGGPTPQG
ncbi:unnamed protein product [Calypogeia fissa]